jgi:hypothetical protein
LLLNLIYFHIYSVFLLDRTDKNQYLSGLIDC